MSAETPASAAAPGGVGLESDDIWGADGDGEDTAFGFDVASKTTAELRQQRVSIENEIRVIKSNIRHLEFETKKQQETVDDNKSKIKLIMARTPNSADQRKTFGDEQGRRSALPGRADDAVFVRCRFRSSRRLCARNRVRPRFDGLGGLKQSLRTVR